VFAVDIAVGAIQVWHLFAFTLLAGAVNTFNQPARAAFVFDVVPESVVPNAVAVSNIALSTGRMLAAAGAGAAIVALGAAANYFVQSLAYLGVMGTVLAIRTKRRGPTGRARPAFWQGIVEGFGYARRNPQMRLLLLIMVINPVFYIPIHDALLPIFATSVLPGGAQSLGLLLGALGAGGLLGGLLTASLSHVDRRGLMQLMALLAHGFSLATFCVVALTTHELWLALPILLVSGIAESLHMTTNQTVLQLLAPDHLRGRVTSFLQLAIVLNPIGVLAAGVLADYLGPTGAGVALSLGGFALTTSIFVGSARMRTLRLSRLRELGQQGLHPAGAR
jgi:predicted MFS family arabinose efflux permease